MALSPRSPPEPAHPPARRRLHLVRWPARPTTRGECAELPRPCPFATCRYSLSSESRPPWELPAKESCALDVVDDKGPLEQFEVARLMGFVRPWSGGGHGARRRGRSVAVERVRHIEVAAKRRLFSDAGIELAELHELFREQPTHEDLGGSLETAVEYFGDEDAPGTPTPGSARTWTAERWADEVLVSLHEGLVFAIEHGGRFRLRQAWAKANERENRMGERQVRAPVDTIHVFHCSANDDHVTKIHDDGRPEGAAFGIALRQTRLRFPDEQCDAWVKTPDGKGRERCKGTVREHKETAEL